MFREAPNECSKSHQVVCHISQYTHCNVKESFICRKSNNTNVLKHRKELRRDLYKLDWWAEGQLYEVQQG